MGADRGAVRALIGMQYGRRSGRSTGADRDAVRALIGMQ